MQGNPLLADFGLSPTMGDTTSVNAPAPKSGGTLRGVAPELLEAISSVGSIPTVKSDIYALSMVIIEVGGS